jgi:phosphoribosylaminoimidazole-succinocarboxamide synthase
MSQTPVMTTQLDGLELLNRGKVRDIYRVPAEKSGGKEMLLLVATDRISAFDVVLPNGVPDKGKVLTQTSAFWFRKLADVVPNHVVTTDVDQMPAAVKKHAAVLRGRSTLGKRCDPFPVECVVRGYLAGSGLKEYAATGAVCGIKLPPGLVESSKLPQPIFTPSTKAEKGHDENIDFEKMASIVGRPTAEKLRDLTLTLFTRASEYAATRGILLADTKFEFGLDDGRITLIDEALTPDSSRYWEAAKWTPGKAQQSYDKQPVRDWLETTGWNKKPPAPVMPPDAVAATSKRYREIYERLSGEKLS